MTNQLIFLGTGSSAGVPLIGCSCSVCHSRHSFNKRLRPSVLLKIKDKQFLIDAGPDFREQALKINLKHLDAVILTHAHRDHTAGIDDLRPLCYGRLSPLPVLLSAATAADIKIRYSYIFHPSSKPLSFTSPLHLNLLPEKEGKLEFENLKIDYFSYEQGGMEVNGFRFNQLAYLTDIRHFSPSLYTRLKGVENLIISALRYTSSALHLSVHEAIDFAEQSGAKRVWLTHLSHELDYEETMAKLPSHVCLAYDGLKINFE